LNLQSELEIKSLDMGAAYFGVASLSLARDGAVTPYEQKLISEYTFGISVGVPLSMEIVDNIGDQTDKFALSNYGHHVYGQTNPEINHITAQVSYMLMEQSYDAIPIPASQTIDVDNLFGIFSNKLSASLSGLGWIGRSCLLITPEKGPRVRWGTVLTNAPLEAGSPIKQRCGKCVECVDACPAGAFTGRAFVQSEGREKRMIANNCNDYIAERRKNLGYRTCGMCVHICPWGKPKGER